MNTFAVFKTENYDDETLYTAVKKHLEIHNIKDEFPKNARVLLKPNLVTDKEAAFSVTTNPRFVFAVIRCLYDIGVKNITVADCPGGALLVFSQIQEVYEKTGYSFLADYAYLNTDFTGIDVNSPDGFVNKKFNIIKAVSEADYIINLPKFKTHNITGITAGVKNLFGTVPGLQKPAFHAKYPLAKDFSNMLVELAAVVKPNFTIVDAVDIMEGNGPTNGKKRYLGLTFSGKDVFTLDSFIAKTLGIAQETVPTITAAKAKGFVDEKYLTVGDTDFATETPILLSELTRADTAGGKIAARISTLLDKAQDAVFMQYPQMNEKCILCKKCIVTCPKKALSIREKRVVLDRKKCIGCLCCDEVCTNGAVDIRKKLKTR